MSIRDSLVGSIEFLRKRFYRGPIRTTVVSLGLESRFRAAYSRILGEIANEDIVSHEVGGITAQFIVKTGLEVQRFRNLMEEFDVIESLLEEVTEDDIFYDIGANVGLYTCFIAQRVDRTIAFEPHPKNLKRLKENVELNSLTNVTARPEALSNVDEKADLAVTGASIAGEGTHSLGTGTEQNSVEVETVRGDAVIGELPYPDVIKIDVEGAELNVLRGMENALSESCHLCYVEVHPDKITKYDGTAEEVSDLLTELGFEIEQIHERGGDEYFLKCRREITNH